MVPVFGSMDLAAGEHKVVPLKAGLIKNLKSDPAIRAFLDTIAYAEGTFHAGPEGYKLGYPKPYAFKSYERHPKTVRCAISRKKRLCSSAAGRYMFLHKTWDTIAKKLHLSDFSPLNQDIAALYLLHEQGAISDIQKEHFKEAINKVKHIWSSLPGSPYGQPRKKMADLKKRFQARLEHYRKYLQATGRRQNG